MRTIPGTTPALTLLLAFATLIVSASGAAAQGNLGGNNPNYFNNQSYSYGLQLPQVPQPNGQDEIRAADGTTCRSNAASNGAYLDMGGIGGQGIDGSFDSGTVYGRLIVPLGDIPKRLDCSALYGLEIQRLTHELELVRAGINGGSGAGLASAAAPGKPGKAWAEDGWSNKGWKGASKPGAADTAQAAAEKLPLATIVPMRLQPKGSPNAMPVRYVPADAAEPGIELMPWSSEPAVGGRILTSGPIGSVSKAATYTFPDQIGLLR